MKITVTQENLHKALQNVSRVASAKTPLPILNNILLKTESNRLFIAATNLEVAITEYIGAKIEKDGAITIPAKLLTEFISNLPKGNIEIEKKDQSLVITSNHYNSTINGLEVEEFPELPVINEKDATEITLPTLLFKRMVAQTIPAASNDTTRPMLTGVYFHTHDKKLYTVATDGYRLAEKELINFDKDIEAIIPVVSLQEVVRIITEDHDEVKILIDENQARFRIGDSEVTSKLIDAKYVDYRQLIPKQSETTIRIAKDEFVRITKVASLFARESAGGITLSADETSGLLSIHSVASQLGENTSEAEAAITGVGQVTLNSRYLLEALLTTESQEVEFSFSGKLSPCVLKDSGEKVGYQHIIMPLKS